MSTDLQALSDAASRVRKFLDERESGRGLSDEVAFFNGHPLAVADLETLLRAATPVVPDGLREAAEAVLVELDLIRAHREKSGVGYPTVNTDKQDALRAALVASPSPDTDAGLDVERLARAWLNTMTEGEHNENCLDQPGQDCPVGAEVAEFTPKVAAEYARLATPDKDQPV